MTKKITIEVAIGIILLIALIIGGGVYFSEKRAVTSKNIPIIKTDPKFCTQEAKLCPDGSYVSRTGPNCEFALCPSNEDKSENCFYDSGRVSGSGCFWENTTQSKNGKCEVNTFPPRFRENFNEDNTDSLVLYKNIEKDIELMIPYNEKWGNSECKVNEYMIGENGAIYFGKPTFLGEFTLEFLESKKTNEILGEQAEINGGKGANPQKYLDLSLEEVNGLGVYKINGMEVVRVNNFGMCETVDMIVIGSKFNYKFSSCSGKNVKETMQKLEDIIKTIKFIN